MTDDMLVVLMLRVVQVSGCGAVCVIVVFWLFVGATHGKFVNNLPVNSCFVDCGTVRLPGRHVAQSAVRTLSQGRDTLL